MYFLFRHIFQNYFVIQNAIKMQLYNNVLTTTTNKIRCNNNQNNKKFNRQLQPLHPLCQADCQFCHTVQRLCTHN